MGTEVYWRGLMCCSDNYLKGLVRLAERAQGFLDDGYMIMFQTKGKYDCYIKLRHPNGNIVSLQYDAVNGNLTQRTNGRETHQEKVR